MIRYQPKIKGFVGVLDISKIYVFVYIRLKRVELVIGACFLFFDRFDFVGQQTLKIKLLTLALTKRAALIEQWRLKQCRACEWNINRPLFNVRHMQSFWYLGNIDQNTANSYSKAK